MTASDVSRVACGQTSRVKELLRQHARQDACRDSCTGHWLDLHQTVNYKVYLNISNTVSYSWLQHKPDIHTRCLRLLPSAMHTDHATVLLNNKAGLTKDCTKSLVVKFETALCKATHPAYKQNALKVLSWHKCMFLTMLWPSRLKQHCCAAHTKLQAAAQVTYPCIRLLYSFLCCGMFFVCFDLSFLPCWAYCAPSWVASSISVASSASLS